MATGDLTKIISVKSYLGMDLGETSRDDEISAKIASESARFKSLAANPVLRATYASELHSGDGSKSLDPLWAWPNYPLASVAALSVNGESIPARASPGLDGWFVSGSRVMLSGYRFSCGEDNIEITYDAGHAEAPPDVAAAVVEMVAMRLRGAERIGIMSQTVGGESVSYQTLTLPESVQSVINAYRPRFCA